MHVNTRACLLMRAAILTLIAIYVVVGCALSPAISNCVQTKKYATLGTPEHVIYTALSSGDSRCNDSALSISCSYAAAAASGMSAFDFMCFVNCANAFTECYPESLRPVFIPCPSMPFIECLNRLSSFFNSNSK